MAKPTGRCNGVKDCEMKSCEHHPVHELTKECENCCDWQDNRSCVEYAPVRGRGTKK